MCEWQTMRQAHAVSNRGSTVGVATIRTALSPDVLRSRPQPAGTGRSRNGVRSNPSTPPLRGGNRFVVMAVLVDGLERQPTSRKEPARLLDKSARWVSASAKRTLRGITHDNTGKPTSVCGGQGTHSGDGVNESDVTAWSRAAAFPAACPWRLRCGVRLGKALRGLQRCRRDVRSEFKFGPQVLELGCLFQKCRVLWHRRPAREYSSANRQPESIDGPAASAVQAAGSDRALALPSATPGRRAGATSTTAQYRASAPQH